MYLCVCIYIYIYVCVCVYIYVYICIYIYIYRHLWCNSYCCRKWNCVCVYIYIYIYAHTIPFSYNNNCYSTCAYIYIYIMCVCKCLWYHSYHCKKWTLLPKFKSWMRLFAFHFVLMPLRKARIHLFSWVACLVSWILRHVTPLIISCQ